MYLLHENILIGVVINYSSTEIISKPFVVTKRLFTSNQDCTRAIMQQFLIGLTIEQGNIIVLIMHGLSR
jgi:hypothetical protein